jgi:hypothetical protein
LEDIITISQKPSRSGNEGETTSGSSTMRVVL